MRYGSIVAESLFLKVPCSIVVSLRYADDKVLHLRAAARVMSAKPRQSPDLGARSYLDGQGGTLDEQIWTKSASETATAGYFRYRS
jgi:hypothetical protein